MKHLTMTKLLAITFILFFSFAGCNKFVQNIEPPIDSTEDANLNSEEEVGFLILGVKGKFAASYSELSCLAGGLSDELIYAVLPGATYPQFFEIDEGDIKLNNGTVENAINNLGSFRLHADTLLGRALSNNFSYLDSNGKSIRGWKDSSVRKNAIFNGYFYGGLARYLWASYFALSPNNGGGIINAGPFIPSSDMYNLAIDYFTKALENTEAFQERAIVQSFIAKIYLIQGQYRKASDAAEVGLEQNAPQPFTAKFSRESANYWFNNAGLGRTQLFVPEKYYKYIANDFNEASRIPIALTGDGASIYRQYKYYEAKSPMDIMTWQEVNLMRAELAIRLAANAPRLTKDDTIAVLKLLNPVRESHGLEPRTKTGLDSIIVERDKELFCTGNRLIDQNRFNRWHLSNDAWHFLPITTGERSRNKNLPK
jgi:tetratricopeptide (TPR) repeat protein